MQTLTINSKAAQVLAKSAAKARVEKPVIKKTNERGVYQVKSKSGSTYTVCCNSQDKTISCNCKAVKPCYHIASVANYHSFLVSQEIAAQKAVSTCKNCETAPATSKEGRCDDCEVARANDELFG